MKCGQVLQVLEGEQKDRNLYLKPLRFIYASKTGKCVKDALKLEKGSEQMDATTTVEWFVVIKAKGNLGPQDRHLDSKRGQQSALRYYCVSPRLRYCGSTSKYLFSKAEGKGVNGILYGMRDYASRMCIA